MENQTYVGDQNTQQIEQNPVNKTAPVQEKLKTNYFVIGTVILICFVIFGFGGYYLGKRSSQNTNLNLNQTRPLPASIENDPTANWKTYTNTEAGFSLRYPGDYFVFQSNLSDSSDGFFVATSPTQGGDSPKFLPNATDVWLTAFSSKNVNVQTLDEYLASQEDSSQIITKIPTTIGSMNGYKVVSTVQSYCAGDSCTTIYVYDGLLLKNNSIYTIALSSLDQKTLYANEAMFDQVLSTFKFLNSSNNTTSNTDNYDKAIQILQTIPEIQTIQNSVIKAGRKTFFIPGDVNGDIVEVWLYEGGFPDGHSSRIDTFNVNIKSKVITVDDGAMISGQEFISLDEWKKTVKERFQ